MIFFFNFPFDVIFKKSSFIVQLLLLALFVLFCIVFLFFIYLYFYFLLWFCDSKWIDFGLCHVGKTVFGIDTGVKARRIGCRSTRS